MPSKMSQAEIRQLWMKAVSLGDFRLLLSNEFPSPQHTTTAVLPTCQTSRLCNSVAFHSLANDCHLTLN